jgi:proteasome activator subunit 3 (PA28 gamma)
LTELDEREFGNLRLNCLELRNNYAILHDLILKNIDKIKQPRSADHYGQMV